MKTLNMKNQKEPCVLIETKKDSITVHAFDNITFFTAQNPNKVELTAWASEVEISIPENAILIVRRRVKA